MNAYKPPVYLETVPIRQDYLEGTCLALSTQSPYCWSHWFFFWWVIRQTSELGNKIILSISFSQASDQKSLELENVNVNLWKEVSGMVLGYNGRQFLGLSHAGSMAVLTVCRNEYDKDRNSHGSGNMKKWTGQPLLQVQCTAQWPLSGSTRNSVRDQRNKGKGSKGGGIICDNVYSSAIPLLGRD